MKLPYFLQKIFKVVGAKAVISGLEISDLFVRFAHFDGKRWDLKQQKLEGGVVENGVIKNYPAFIESLRALQGQILGKQNSKRRVNVIVSLSSANVYSQIFGLPIMSGENLEKAIDLNLQALSPEDASQSYSSWQIVGRDKATVRIDVLGGFVSHAVIDELSRALNEAGFFTVAIEFKALSLARLLKGELAGFDEKKSYIVVNLDSAGLDLLVVRHGELYFEYFNSWRDIQGEEREISSAVFKAAVSRNLSQVLNFYGQHWPDALNEIVVSTGALNEEVAKGVRENFSMVVRDFKLKISEPINSEWFVAMGSALRASVPRTNDGEINFLSFEAQEEFHKERFLVFAEFWRVLFPVSLALLLVVFLVGDLFLIRMRRSIEANPLLQGSAGDYEEIQKLEAQIQKFNRSVALIRIARDQAVFKTPVIQKLDVLAKENKITIDSLSFGNSGVPAVLIGQTDSEEQIRLFKKALEGDGAFQNVNLPLEKIQPLSSRGFAFSLSFTINFENTE